MQTVGLLPHKGKHEAMEATVGLIEALTRAGLRVRLDPAVASCLGYAELGVPADSFTRDLDLAIALGGDGALLRAAQIVYPHQILLFGVNFGHLGFLAEVEARHLPEIVARVLAGDFRTEERLMVRATCGGSGRTAVGLNDVVIAKGVGTHLIALEISVNGVPLTNYRADGLIVATPTGSTAYSLSAGGPILHPGVAALVLTPVCAHALHARPLVVGANDSITATVFAPHDEVTLVADGQAALSLAPGETVYFSRAEATTRLVSFRGPGFYEVLQERFKEGKI